jgi:hypothetical protein
MGEGSLPAAEAEALIPQFVFEKLLNQGTINHDNFLKHCPHNYL